MKKTGVLGSGIVARTLAKGLIAIGHEVMMGSRDASKLQDIAGIKTGTFEEAAEFGDLLVLAVKGSAAATVLSGCNIDGKTIIDTTNPIADVPPVNGVLQYFTSANNSLGQELQKLYPDANFVKAFNSVGNQFMVNPEFNDGKPSMFICGNSDDAKQEVKDILDAFGWLTEDMGKIEAAGAIESLCVLWCIPGINGGGWNHAFKLLHG